MLGCLILLGARIDVLRCRLSMSTGWRLHKADLLSDEVAAASGSLRTSKLGPCASSRWNFTR